MKPLFRLAFIPVALAVVVFALANRQPVTIDLWPLPFAVDLPVYLAVLGALALGLLVGGSVQRVSGAGRRRRASARLRGRSKAGPGAAPADAPRTARTLLPRRRARP